MKKSFSNPEKIDIKTPLTMQKTPLFPKGRVVVTLMTLAATLPVMQVHAQSSIAMREIARRQEATATADRLLGEGRAAYASGDYQKAVDKYRQALDKLPVGPVVQDRREEYIKHLADGSVALSQAYRKVGKYEEARALLQNVLKADPQNLIAQREMNYLDDPIRTNPALTYEHTQNVDKVRRGLYTAEGAYNIGKFDQAKREYENVLRVDPYNSAAQRGIERVNAAKSEYYKAAYDRTRSEMLTQVDKAWETVLPGDVPVVNSNEPAAPSADAGISYINDKLRRIVIPNIDFDNTSLDEAIDFLRLRANELDTTEIDPARKGINFVVRAETAAPGVGAGAAAGTPSADGSAPAAPSLGSVATTSPKISQLRLRNVPLTQALRYICEQAKYRYEVDDFSVVLIPLSQGGSSSMYTRTFQVSPNFRSFLNEGSADAGAAPANSDPFATPAAGASGLGDSLKPQKSVQELIASKGVKFPEGSTIFLSGNRLTVRNSPENLDLIETLVNSSLTGAPKQVKITTKFVEISQENTEELGFDWIVSPFGFASTGNGVAQAFLGGGVMGNGAGRVVNNFIGNVNGNAVTGLGGSGQPTNIVTGGLRSGDGAITRNSIDAVLNNPNRTSQSSNPAPGILGLTGVFDQNQIQMIMRGLSQKKGADLMTAPSVLAKSAQKATIEIVREFIYPTEYEPPQLPNSVGVGGTVNGGNGGLGGLGVNTSSSAGIFPVTPATPTAFETRNTGVSLEIEPTITDNDLTIDLKMLPQIVEFEGFVNYGSPIQSFSTNALGQSEPITITENRIEMPVFSRRSVNTSLTIYDGYTVAVGGLMREDVQNVEDKVPILGDIPVVGRLFQSKAENRVKSNLIIFVTAQIIDAAGRPLRGSAEASTPSVGGGTPVSTEVGLPAVGGVNDAPADGVIPLPN